MKIKQRFPLLVCAIAVVLVSIFVATFVVIELQKSDALIINLAGRQRMLSQKMAKEVEMCIALAAKNADFGEAEKKLGKSKAVFDATLNALSTGSQAPKTLDAEGALLKCPVPSQMVKQLLDKQKDVWKTLAAALDKIAGSKYKDAQDLDVLSMELLASAEAAVQRMQVESEGRTQLLVLIQVAGILVSGICLLLIIMAIFGMLKKLGNVNNLMDTYGKGNLTERAEVKDRKDELDDTLFQVNRLGENIASIVGEIYATNKTLISVSKDFTNEFTKIADNAESMKKRSLTVAAASEESTASIHSISSATEEMSATIQTVATSMEQMNLTINEIARNCQNESKIAADAQEKGIDAKQQMTQLGKSAKEIGSIIDVITNIADKTRMLSLNATIEAASAGEAGKGFAVVANEVKELSRQTTNAAEEVRTRIESMLSSSEASAKALEGIVSIIDDVNTISQTIVAAVEEQSATAGEIAKNVGQGSEAANEIARNVSETATAITQVSSNIQEVSGETSKVSDSIINASAQAKQLGELGQNLQGVVSMFHIKTAFFEWTDELSVGINEVDVQHKKLINMINALNDAISEGRAKEAVKKVLDELADYTVSHFGMEENYFKQYNYPEYTGHKALHDKFVAKVVDAQKSMESGRAMVGRDIMIFLKEWLVEHIMKTDKRYAPFLKKHGVR